MSLDTLSAHVGDADDLARILGRALLTSHWLPGDLFPRELDVAAHFGVSRNLVRNALTQLAATGLIVRTAGRGTLVRDLNDWHLLDPRLSDWMSGLVDLNPQLLREIYAFRLSAEPVVTALAATAATADDLQRIEAAFEGMAKTATSAQKRLKHAEYDVAFHDAVYQASHNLVWRQMEHLLRPSILALVQRSQHSLTALDDSLARHGRIVEAIRRGDGEQAATAARAVLERTAEDLGLAWPGIHSSQKETT